MDEPAPTTEDQHPREVGRIESFSDGVFAIAITLVSLEIIVPMHDDLGVALSQLAPNFFALALSFAVVGSYWVFHHKLFSAVVRYDRRLIWINLLVLFFIVLTPFSTSVIADFGEEPLGVIVYALVIMGAGYSSAGLTAYVFVGHRMCALSVSPAMIRYSIVRSLVVPTYFGASLLLFLIPVSTSFVLYSWFGIIAVNVLVERTAGRSAKAA
jgi:uncharacterized membrane protein